MAKIDITKQVRARPLQDSGLSAKEIARCKNFWALGLTMWLYNRPLEPEERSIREKFKKNPEIAEGNVKALNAGWSYGETTELFTSLPRPPGQDRARHATATSWATRRPRSASSPRRNSPAEALLRQLPDHARLGHPPLPLDLSRPRRDHVPGRGRDRRRDLGDRRRVRRQPRRHRDRRAPASRSRVRPRASPS